MQERDVKDLSNVDIKKIKKINYYCNKKIIENVID